MFRIVVEPALDLAGDLLIDIPQFDTQTQGSTNNSFSGQTNIINPYALKPVVCGSPRVYPYLAAPPLEYYIGNQQVLHSNGSEENGGKVAINKLAAMLSLPQYAKATYHEVASA